MISHDLIATFYIWNFFETCFLYFGLFWPKRPKFWNQVSRKMTIIKSSHEIMTNHNLKRKFSKIWFSKILASFWPFFLALMVSSKLLTYAMIHYTPFATIYVKRIKIAMLAGVFSFMYCSWNWGTPWGWPPGSRGSIILFLR